MKKTTILLSAALMFFGLTAKAQTTITFDTEDGSTWTELCPNMQTTTVGYKRIIPLNGSTSSSYGNGYNAKKLRITIEDSRACPLLSNLNVY